MLTKSAIDHAKPKAQRYVLWDGDGGVPGFGVRVAPTGARIFIITYRLKGADSRSPRASAPTAN